MKILKSITALSLGLILSLVTNAQILGTYLANGETATEPPAGWTVNGLTASTSAPLNGTKSFKSVKPGTTTAEFKSGTVYSIYSKTLDLTGAGNGFFVDMFHFRYGVTQAIGTGTWTVKFVLWNITDNVKTAAYTVSGTTNVANVLFDWNAMPITIDLPPGKVYRVGVEATTTNTSTSTSNFVKIDDVWFEVGYLLGFPPMQTGYMPWVQVESDHLYGLNGNVYGQVIFEKSATEQTHWPFPPGYTVTYGVQQFTLAGAFVGWVSMDQQITIPYNNADTASARISDVLLRDANYYYLYYITNVSDANYDQDGGTAMLPAQDASQYRQKRQMSTVNRTTALNGCSDAFDGAVVYSTSANEVVDSYIYTAPDGDGLYVGDNTYYHRFTDGKMVKIGSGGRVQAVATCP